ncbi:Type 1 glutamine amidotransferase-like domain-containing protein [Spirillospora sp. CA-294931]|uniref:Type 1 glutamine amidotransferase-like domain-containing protein n=1 Tax=Spirillospora sp. CA-294931 TaxID=3240042 RepID=UPI003D8B53A7
MRQRLFLGSAGLGALPGWLASLPVVPGRAILVPTASKPMASAPFVEGAERLLVRQGMVVERLDLECADRVEVERVLRSCDLVFVTGGYAIFLLEHVRRTGFDRVVAEAVRRGRTVDVGVSAGAALAGPDLGFFADAEDPGRVASTAGLGLVPFTVLPHRGRGNAERHDRQDPARFVSLEDDQAVVVDGASWEIRASGGQSLD